MTVRALRAFRVEGIIQGIAQGETLDMAEHVAQKHIAAGDAEDIRNPVPVLAPEPVPEVIETREPEVENRDPVPVPIKKRKKNG